jgi:hypothetical protein
MPLPKQAAKVSIIFNYTKSDNDRILNKLLLNYKNSLAKYGSCFKKEQ